MGKKLHREVRANLKLLVTLRREKDLSLKGSLLRPPFMSHWPGLGDMPVPWQEEGALLPPSRPTLDLELGELSLRAVL